VRVALVFVLLVGCRGLRAARGARPIDAGEHLAVPITIPFP
jgi:hypothetical protein